MNIKKVDASKRFFKRLKGVTDPEKKRKLIGNEFIRVFEDEAKNKRRRIPRAGYSLSGRHRERFVQGAVSHD